MPCLFVTTFCTYYAACRLGFRCILLPRVYWHSRRASNKPTAYISYPCFPFSPIFPSVYMGLDCSGSDIVDSSAILMEKLMKNTENKRILTCLTMSKIKYIRKEYLSSSGSYLSLVQNILLLYVVCVCVFSVFNFKPLPDRSTKANCLSGMLWSVCSDALIVRFSLC